MTRTRNLLPVAVSARLRDLNAVFGAVVMASALTIPALAQTKSDQKFPDVVDVKVIARGGETFDFDVTISSPYDTAQRYADAFRVMSADGKVNGERILAHDHETEQPFSRDLHGVKIPAGISRVVVQARDQKNGYGGKTRDVALPGR